MIISVKLKINMQVTNYFYVIKGLKRDGQGWNASWLNKAALKIYRDEIQKTAFFDWIYYFTLVQLLLPGQF